MRLAGQLAGEPGKCARHIGTRRDERLHRGEARVEVRAHRRGIGNGLDLAMPVDVALQSKAALRECRRVADEGKACRVGLARRCLKIGR